MERIAFVSAWHGATLAASRWGAPLARRQSRLFPIPLNNVRNRRVATASVATATGEAGKKQARKRNQDASPYSATVNLPQTTFEQRANATKKEPQIQKFWSDKSVYERLSRENPGETFVLHDGPPFANGPLHCGHALNKILKDIINKYQLMKGKKAVFVPGWDTHGLPIELKVLQSLKGSERRNLSPVDLRKKARSFALETVDKHIEGMKRFGVWGDWDEPYLTLNPEYEAAQMEVFGIMYAKGYVFRGKKPVHWSPSSRTALAEAELEYPEGHTSRSCYCAFQATSAPDNAPKPISDAIASPNGLALSIWTTTPWTIPANRAVAINVDLEYALVTGLHPKQPDLAIVVAKDLVESTSSKLDKNENVKILSIVKGEDLVGVEYSHPLEDNKVCRVVEGGDYITTDTGTGLVHTAPGHGQEDYLTGLRENLDIVSPVNDAGKFTEEAANGRFAGMPVLGEGNQAVLDALSASNVLLLEESYSHKYPYDWRTKKPTIFRATEQWFISIDDFREDVLKAIENVEWFPATGIKRIRGMVEGRGDWCISRQRAWGVPIPVFYDDSTGTTLMSQDIVNHVKEIIRERGTDAWWELEADELLPEKYRGRNLRKGRDTMDVWFDSGSSWAAVASQRNSLSYPVDLYLEGSDQHRGWFQSSILTSVAAMEKAPYKKVLTHGFVLDEKGIKMSKSIGNVIDPLKVISGGNNKKKEPPYGSDVLRLWVSSVDYSSDIMIGPSILKQVADVYKKLRNTLRYMLGNIHDFVPAKHEVSYDSLPSLDRYILSRMMSLTDEVEAAYDSFSFFKVYQALQRFAVVDLSNFYLDIAKDRLYIPAPDSFRRRSCQTVIASMLENFARALAPIVSHTAEDLWQNMPYVPCSMNSSFPQASSVYEAGWFERRSEWVNVDKEVMDDWAVVLEARDAVNKVLEAARAAKTLGASMEASVKIFAADPADAATLRKMVVCPNDVDSLKRAFIVSDVEVTSTADLVTQCAHMNTNGKDGQVRFVVGIDKASAPKCDRCWHYDDTVGTHFDHPLLCSRCNEAVVEMGFSSVPTEQSGVV
ncbi:Isoleucine--tRNA ligase [Gracilaria domingensis]|nr:Isoleucine--tRNA ligase [Gracilaria domingensis]